MESFSLRIGIVLNKNINTTNDNLTSHVYRNRSYERYQTNKLRRFDGIKI
jgi:hypothetical protein